MGHQQASNAARIQLYISALHKYSKDFASNPEQTMNEHKLISSFPIWTLKKQLIN